MTKINREDIDSILELACTLQQIPSPTFHEENKAAFVAEQLRAAGLCEVQLDAAGNALGCLPGGKKRPLIISAHMDTVHPLSTSLILQRTPERVSGPAIGDNSLGLAVLIHLARKLSESGKPLPGDIWLVGNVGEEGLGDLKGMRALVDRFGSTPAAYLILEGMGLGQVYHRGLGVERYRISAKTAGGHSWVDYGKPSAIHHLAELITRITALPVPRRPRTSLNVGIITGGTSVNTIASLASFELDMRSEDSTNLKNLTAQVRRLVETYDFPGVTFTLDLIGKRPAGGIKMDHPFVRLVEDSLVHVGVQPHLEIASTDANIPLALGIPAVCMGLTTGANAHTANEYFDVDPVRKGLTAVIEIINSTWQVLDR